MEVNLDFSYKILSYWNISDSLNSQLTFKSHTDYIEESAEKIVEYVEKQLVSDVEIGNLLSGGLDSSVLYAIGNKKLNKKINNFNTYFKLKDYDESKDSREIVKLKDGKLFQNSYTDKEIIQNLDKYISIIDQPSYQGINTF